MVSRKRVRDEMEAEAPAKEPTTLNKLRNMWQFANLAQYLALFIEALRIDKDFDIEDLESECLKPQPSEKLAQIGLALLKHVSSHRGLTPEIFDEYARRQFVAKAPGRNPFGIEETPNKFDDFDVFTKIRVLQQLSVWTLNNPNTIREKMNATEAEQMTWRMDPIGFDREERTYYVLDDNRLYRRTEPPPPPPPKKAKSKAKSKKSRGTRASKRRKTSTPPPEEDAEEDEEAQIEDAAVLEDDGFGGATWECVCITLEDYQAFLSSIRRSKHEDEKTLYQNIEEDVLPVIEQQAEERAKKEARRLKEQENLLKLATAKRSSRISSRLEKQKEEEAAAEAERKRLADIAMAKAEQEKQRKFEQDRDSRRMTREQRLREREAKRILEEENLRKLEENKKKLASNDVQGRISERHLSVQITRRQEELEKLAKEDEWVFDCEVCGVYGDSYDDGTHIIACDRCNVWQHSKCHGISAEQADRDDFHFICTDCRRKEEEANQPKLPPLKLRFNAASPGSQSQANGIASGAPQRQLSAVQIPVARPATAVSDHHPMQPTTSLLNGPSLSPRGQAVGPPGIHRSEAAYGAASSQANGSSPVRNRSFSNGNGLPTSSPPPTLSFSNSFNAHPQASNAHATTFNPPYGGSFSRPASSAGPGPFSSPIKHSPAPSPKPTPSIPNLNFMSPHSSFPPSSAQQPSYSPTKHSSPPPPFPMMSSPAPVPALPLSHPSSQNPAQVLPDPIPAPEKHDGARPVSSHSFSQTHVFPPVESLSPVNKPQILSPPVKKSSPASSPERSQYPANGTEFGLGGSQ